MSSQRSDEACSAWVIDDDNNAAADNNNDNSNNDNDNDDNNNNKENNDDNNNNNDDDDDDDDVIILYTCLLYINHQKLIQKWFIKSYLHPMPYKYQLELSSALYTLTQLDIIGGSVMYKTPGGLAYLWRLVLRKWRRKIWECTSRGTLGPLFSNMD